MSRCAQGVLSSTNCLRKVAIDPADYHLAGAKTGNTVKTCNAEGESLALSKTAFADCILQREEGFDNIDVQAFSKIFDIIIEIMNRK